MKIQILCIRDVKAATYDKPLFFPTVESAQRTFAKEINRPSEDNLLYQFPEDFTLVHLGQFDEETAEISLLSSPTPVMTGRQCASPDIESKSGVSRFVPF